MYIFWNIVKKYYTPRFDTQKQLAIFYVYLQQVVNIFLPLFFTSCSLTFSSLKNPSLRLKEPGLNNNRHYRMKYVNMQTR